jgi:hypothetical protein
VSLTTSVASTADLPFPEDVDTGLVRKVVATVCGLVLVGACSSAPGPGPIAAEHKTSWSPTVNVRRTWTDGWSVLTLTGHKAAVIDQITFLRGQNGAALRLVDAKIADGTRRHSSFQYDPHWPPRQPDIVPADSMEPAVGTRLQPGHHYELLLGIQATKHGYLVRRGIEIDYHVGSTKYVRVIDSWLGVCTSKQYWRTDDFGQPDCPRPKGFESAPSAA